MANLAGSASSIDAPAAILGELPLEPFGSMKGKPAFNPTVSGCAASAAARSRNRAASLMADCSRTHRARTSVVVTIEFAGAIGVPVPHACESEAGV
jgi:hypothetical protein